ncbi:MAG: synthase N-terminus, partial [Pseudomonadota bacterium]
MPAKLGRPHNGDKPALSGPPSRRTLLALVLVVLVASDRAALGALLQARGYKVRLRKLDPYL